MVLSFENSDVVLVHSTQEDLYFQPGPLVLLNYIDIRLVSALASSDNVLKTLFYLMVYPTKHDTCLTLYICIQYIQITCRPRWYTIFCSS